MPIDWHPIPLGSLQQPDAPFAMTVQTVDGRLFIGAIQNGAPRILFSDEGAASWTDSFVAADVAVDEGWSTDAPTAINEIEGSADRLVAVGGRRIWDTGAHRIEPVIWWSDDFGQSWRLVPASETPPVQSLVWTGDEFLAFSDPSDGGFTAWASATGDRWEPMGGSDPLGYPWAFPEQSAFDGHVVALAAPRRHAPMEVWTTDDGATWRQAELDGEPLTAQAITSGPYGFVAVDGRAAPTIDVLRSGDGLSWSRTRVELGDPSFVLDEAGDWSSDLLGWWLTDGNDGLAINARSPRGTFTPYGQLTWLHAHGQTDAAFSAFVVRAHTWGSGAFFGLQQACGGSFVADACLTDSGLMIGLPIADQDPLSITGILQTGVGSCAQIQEPGGHLWSVILPEGYHFDQLDGDWRVAPLDSDGAVVAQLGDALTAVGGRDEADSRCDGVGYRAGEVSVAPTPGH
jgi:hypothetical protein